jgi:hypothetical protein
MSGPDATDYRPARTGVTRCENLDGASFERTEWPIGLPGASERNIFLVITAYADGNLTVQVVGNALLDQ